MKTETPKEYEPDICKLCGEEIEEKQFSVMNGLLFCRRCLQGPFCRNCEDYHTCPAPEWSS